MSALFIMILWTWSITPLWVNIVGTCLLGFRLMIKLAKFICDIAEGD